MSVRVESHELAEVWRGYDGFWLAACSCGWVSGVGARQRRIVLAAHDTHRGDQ